MGRHSVPDDDDEDGSAAPAVAATAVDVAPRRGRHAVPEDDGDTPTPAPAAAEKATERIVAPADSVARGNQSTAADVELLRTRSDVRARVIAAVVAPFVLYTVALYLMDSFDVYFLWVWIPLVTAGVLAGSILDAAHRKRGSS